MKYYCNIRIVTIARTAAGICLMAAVLLGNHSQAQSSVATTNAEGVDSLEAKLAAAKAQVEALTKQLEALKASPLPERSGAGQPNVGAVSAAAERAIPVVSTPKAPSSSLSSTGEPIIQMEAMSVTGTNIKRMDIEKVLPVTIVSADEMQLRNALTPVDMLTALPQITGVPANESTSGSAGARGDNANINLRGLGANASLILLNGRRLAPDPSTSPLVVNVNQLPNQGIRQIDVLRDGASSIYGSDAVAGVINYIMKTDFIGTELRFRYGDPQGGGGSNEEGTVTFGRTFANGKGRVMTTFDYLYRDSLYLKERSYLANADHSAQAPAPFNSPSSTFNGTGSVGLYPSFQIGAATAITYFRPVNGVPAITAVAPNHVSNPDFYYNGNLYNSASPRTKRSNWYTGAEYDLSDRITAFFNLSLYRSSSMTLRQPISLSAPTSEPVVPVSVDNPFNPYGSRFYSPTGASNPDGTPRLTGTPQPLTLLSEVILDLPPDAIFVSAGSNRILGGLRGKLTDTWTWESAVLYTNSFAHDRSPNSVRESLFRAANMLTNTSSSTGFAAESTAYNAFGYTFKVQGGAVVPDQPYHNPASVINQFIDLWSRDGTAKIESVDARASGSVFTLWSGNINLAIGAEYRKENFSDTRPMDISYRNDFYISSPVPDNRGDRTISSAYAETTIPLVASKNQIPLVDSFEVTGSGRFEKYSDFGNTTRPKVGLNWKPVQSVMFRASFNEGFIAPGLSQLFQPLSSLIGSAPGSTDLYRNPVTKEGPYVTLQISSGNRNLKPATSIGKGFGAVIDVPYVKGLTVTADYWQISEADLIGSRSTTQIQTSDAALLTAYTKQQLAAGVAIGSINVGAGTAAYKGDPAIVRYAPSAADLATFAAYNAANPTNQFAAVGQIVSTNAPLLNLAQGYISGADLGLSYTLPRTTFGRLAVTSDWTYLRKSYTVNAPPNSTPVTTYSVGANGNARWRGTSTLTWSKGAWSSGVSAYYIGKFTDTGATTTQAVWDSLGDPTYIAKQFDAGAYTYRYVVHDTLTYNAFMGYDFGLMRQEWWKPTRLKLGIINVFDTKPPLQSGGFGYSTSVYGGLVPGRTWTLELTKDY